MDDAMLVHVLQPRCRPPRHLQPGQPVRLELEAVRPLTTQLSSRLTVTQPGANLASLKAAAAAAAAAAI
jgi:hypothetical protein